MAIKKLPYFVDNIEQGEGIVHSLKIEEQFTLPDNIIIEITLMHSADNHCNFNLGAYSLTNPPGSGGKGCFFSGKINESGDYWELNPTPKDSKEYLRKMLTREGYGKETTMALGSLPDRVKKLLSVCGDAPLIDKLSEK